MFQRANLDQSSNSPSNRIEKENLLTYFKKVCTEAGIILNYSSNQPHILTQEQSLVIRDLEKLINNHTSYPSNVKEFMEGLKVLCAKEKHYRKALLATELKKANSFEELVATSENKIQQESLFRIFLNVISIQDEVIEMLLEKMVLHATIDENDTSWLHQILSTLRYLPYVKNSDVLTKKLLDILDAATFVSQIEIINTIPEIVTNNQYELAAQHLCKLLNENSELSGVIVDCLNCLNLKNDIRSAVQEKILLELSSGSSLKIFPLLFEFLITDCKQQTLPSMLKKSRNAIDSLINESDVNKETESNKVIIISRLHSTALKPLIADGWINMMTGFKTHTDHKPIDFIILFILHSTTKTHRKAVENLIRKHIQLGILKIPLLEAMFEKYLIPYIFENYLNSMLAIGWSLLRNTNDLIFNYFATVFYKKLFNHEYSGYVQRQDILNNLISLTGTNDQKHIGAILKILHILSEKRTTMEKHTIHLMSILENLDNFNLANVKLLFEILCSLTCIEQCDESMSGLKDELHMLVRKQLASSKQIIRHRGIISSVIMATQIAANSTDNTELEISSESLISISDLPQGAPKEAALLLDLTNKSVASSNAFKGLYYDELSSAVITSQKMDKNFMIWLQETVTGHFQNIFVVEKVPDSINDIELSVQFSLNTQDEIDEPIYINIGELTLKQQNENKTIITLAPYFRLLRLLHYKHNDGILTNIDALLGCGVIMPNTDDIDIKDTHQTKQIADCVYHCINWFRELISGFITQKSKKLRIRVLERVKHIVMLEDLLQNILGGIPGYKLPPSYFDTTQSSTSTKSSEKTVRPKKRFKSSETVNVNDTVASTSVVTQTTTKPSKGKNRGHHDVPMKFREIDTDIIKLLKYNLSITEDNTTSSQLTQIITIDLEQFHFIIRDFIDKLKKITKESRISELSPLNQINPKMFMTDCIQLLPSINSNFNTIANKLKNLTQDSSEHNELFSKETNDLKVCFSLILESYSLIWSWSGFQHSSNYGLLKESLKCTRNLQSQVVSLNRLITDQLNDLTKYTDQCLYVTCAVNMVKTIEALYKLHSSAELQKKLVAVSNKMLMVQWYNLDGNLDSGKNYNTDIQYLIQIYLSGASVKTIYGLVGTLIDQVSDLKTRDEHLQILTSINKLNFHVLFKELCTTLLERIRTEVASLTNSEHLALWRTTALTLQGLMSIVKEQQTRNNLGYFLKKGIGILKLFLTHGIPILEITLRSKTDEVIEIFKTMQVNTRFLHHLCCQSKMKKDANLIALVPQFRLTLETLLYRVKAALVANNCSTAFWMGHLKNKDLAGEEILSQSTLISEENEEQSASEEESDERMDLDLSTSEVV